MANVVKLYYVDTSTNQWELLPNKLLVVDSIADYLATKTALTINDFQYVKNELEIAINVDLSQSYSQPKTSESYKYVSIQNSGEEIHYYFVKKVIWRSKSAVRFELVMDVLNTFKENTDYKFKANTKITREHKDRFTSRRNPNYVKFYLDNINDDFTPQVDDVLDVFLYPSDVGVGKITCIEVDWDLGTIYAETTYDFEQAVGQGIKLNRENDPSEVIIATLDEIELPVIEYYRNIDYISEGINPILQCGNASGTLIEDSSPLNCDWFLVYRNQEDPTESLLNPVECYLIPSEEKEVDAGIITAGRLTATSLQSSYYYAIGLGDKGYTGSVNVTITLDNGVVLSPSVSTNDQRNVLIKRNDDNTMTIYVVYGEVTANTGTDTTIEGVYQCNYLTFSSMPVSLRYGLTELTGKSYEIRQNMISTPWLVGLLSLTNTTNPAYINSIDDLDRTDPRNIKVIKLPYSPYKFTISSGRLVISTDPKWDYIKLEQADESVIYALKLNNLNTKLSNKIENTSTIEKTYANLKVSLTPNISSIANKNYESKLFHSDFYRPTFVYDSFSFTMQLENFNISYLIEHPSIITKTYFDFDVTKTINSRFMFTYNDYSLKYAYENYTKYMPIARNNEEVLYNVPYINYIRNGFNYDVKAKNTALTSSYVGLALSGLSIGASLMLPSAPLKIAGVVASLASMAMSVKNTIVSAVQNEDSIKRKIAETKNQSASVAGSDDVDLMSIYAKNRLKFLVYEPNPIMKDLLFKLFFYAGYASGRMGKPSHNTRVNFDYLECDASMEKLASIPDDCFQELINCFKAGVTYLHKTARTLDKWDFEQKYENWENALLED